MIGLARRPQRLPDYFTSEEADALAAVAPGFPIRMAFRIRFGIGLRVSETLSLRRSDLRLNQDPPVISVRPEAPGNRGRQVPIPADLVESLADLASFHSKNRNRSMLDISRQWVNECMNRTVMDGGIEPARALRHTYGRNCVLRGVLAPVLQQWLGHQSLADTYR